MRFYGELLVFIFLLVTNGRIIFRKHANQDPLVVIAPLSFLLSFLLIIAWGLDIFTAYAFLVSILVVLSNFHASFRYRNRLFVDHYSPLMKFWAYLTIILSLVGIGFLVYFKPVEHTSERLKVTETREDYSGSFRTGFSTDGIFKRTNALVYTFAPQENDEQSKDKPVVILLADKRGETIAYKPYLQFLAAEGFTVCSIDFYTEDCQWFHSMEDLRILRRSAMIFHSIVNNQKFESQREFYTYNTSQEIQGVVSIIKNKFGENQKYFLVTDGMTDTAALDYEKTNPENLTGIFSLSGISEYKTSGYGCVNQVDPLVAAILGQSGEKDFFITKYLVLKTKEQLNLKEKSNDIKSTGSVF